MEGGRGVQRGFGGRRTDKTAHGRWREKEGGVDTREFRLTVKGTCHQKINKPSLLPPV